MWEEVEQKCTSMPSTPSILPSATSHAVVDGTTGGLDDIEGVGGQRGGVEDIMDGVGVVFHPYTYPTIIYLL